MRITGSLAAVLVVAGAANAALVVNPAQPITHEVKVNVIAVADDSGNNAAPLFGTAGEQAAIFGFVDTIWAQAGIDVNFSFLSGTYDNSFALTGAASPRPEADLFTIVNNAPSGVKSADPNTINLFMVRVVPGFAQTSDNTSNGLAILNGNGIAFWSGPNLPGFTGGQEVVAAVLAHEIGHNLGLNHIVEAENLLQASGSGERLNSSQIATALASSLAVPIPEPVSLSLLAAALFVARRKR